MLLYAPLPRLGLPGESITSPSAAAAARTTARRRVLLGDLGAADEGTRKAEAVVVWW